MHCLLDACVECGDPMASHRQLNYQRHDKNILTRKHVTRTTLLSIELQPFEVLCETPNYIDYNCNILTTLLVQII